MLPVASHPTVATRTDVPASPHASARSRHLALGAALLVVALAAIAVRWRFAPLIPPLLNPDSEGYVQAGWDLFRGNGLDLGLRRTPGYGVFVAGAFALLGERLTSIVLAQHALGVVNAVLAGVIAARVLGPIGALIIGLLTAISGPMLLYEHFVMTETLSATALLLALIGLIRALDTRSIGWSLVAGLLTGVALLCRPALQIILVVGVAGMVVSLWRSPRRLLLCVSSLLVGACVFMLPWMVKNAVLYDNFTLAGPGRHLLFRLVRSDDGFSFARPGSSAEPEAEPMASARRVLMEQAAKSDRSSNYQRFREELGLTEAQTNTLQTALALEAIRGQPVYFLQGTLDIFIHVFIGEPIVLRREGSDLAEVDWDRPIRHLVTPPPPRGDRGTAQHLLSIWDPARLGILVPALFALGALVALTVRRNALVLLIAIVALAPQLLGAAMAGFALRFRYPFDPLIAIVAAYGLASLAALALTSARRRRGTDERRSH